MFNRMGLVGDTRRCFRGSLDIFHGCDKTVALSCDGLYEKRARRIVFEDLANFPDSSIDAVVRIQEDTLAPNPFYDLVARNQLPSLLKKKKQQLHRNPLQLQHAARTM